jgi:uncharacterized protein YqjF (DUF2071 family)
MMRKFLTAEWRDLIMANYEVEPEMLSARVPAGTQLDLNDGRCFLSLVAFMFLDTKVLGVPIPFHVNFEEVNLRFYVKRLINDEIRRGVVFVKEIVPRYAIATVARVMYGEPYECWIMSNRRDDTLVSYEWRKGNYRAHVSVKRGENLGVPVSDSHGSFIIEHYWGYTARGRGRTDEYKVEHPKWDLYTTMDQQVDVDFSNVYGREFSSLNRQQPYSVVLAAGSEISVYKGEKIR